MVTNRIKALRSEMQKRQIKAYLIPSIDAHQSEYVPALWQRRPFISGFNGSAGDVVITMQNGGLWTDGRYYAQAEEQLSGSGIDLFRASDGGTPTIPDFLKTELQKGDIVAADPKTFSVSQAQSLMKEIKSNGLQFEFIEENLIDIIWEDQPELPKDPIKIHPIKYAGESVESKLSRIRRAIAANDCYAHVITMLDAIAWTFNLRGKDVDFNPVFIAYAIITQDDAYLFTRSEKITEEVRRNLGNAVHIFDYSEFKTHLDKLAQSAKRIWIDGTTTNYWIYSMLYPKCDIYNGMSPVIKFKAIKNEAELNGYRACHIRDGVAMVNFLHWLDNAVPKGGITELSATEKLLEFRQQQDMFQGPSFSSISSYKIHGAIIHYSVTKESDIPLEAEGVYLIDSGGQYLDGTTDITRTVALGTVGDEEKENFTRVLMGHINLCLTSFPKGTNGPALDVISRQALWEIGLNFNHGTGHGVGAYLGVHEGPQAINPSRGFGVALEPGMILSNEPGYYKNKQYGMRVENLINVVPDKELSSDEFEFYKFENATICPIDTRLIKKSVMQEKHINWLNEYHERVLNILSPFVSGEVKDWLKNATKAV
ncbi:MAG: aminopeptidase P family protein [Calditrichaeota bacterium]|nr:aminopeptidase P family protein [Calditrichota bacterium]